jgi:solute carrier family 1 (high affinity glutamate transporter) protein 1
MPDAAGGRHRVLIGILGGIVVGTLVGGVFPDVGVKFAFLGDMFLNALMMIVVPLVVFSMIVGITGLGDVRNLGAMGWRTMAYYMATTGLSVLVGLFLVNLTRPGVGVSYGEEHTDVAYTISGEDSRTVVLEDRTWRRTRYQEYVDKYTLALADQNVEGVIASIAPGRAAVRFWQRRGTKDVVYIRAEDGTRLPFRRVGGRLVSAEPEVAPSGRGLRIALAVAEPVHGKEERGVGNTLQEVVVGLIPRNVFDAMARTDVLPLIVFALLFGAVLSVLGERGRVAMDVISGLNEAIMRLVHWLMLVAPVGIFGIVAARIGRAGGFQDFLPELAALGKYSGTVVFGLAIHSLITLPLILSVVGRRNPVRYAGGVGAALLNAFSTASSSATLPLTMEGVEEENGISNRTASFVLPLGATINMDGTALYEAVAAMFIAQVHGIALDPAQQFVIFLTATLAAIGAAGIPEAGLVTMVIVLRAVNLPIEGITLILAVDWLLDRFRTTVNVWGDAVGAGVIETLEARHEARAAASG